MENINNGCAIDGNGYIVTPSGVKAARVHDGCLWLYDKRAGAELPFTQQDLAILFTQSGTHDGGGNAANA